MPTKFQVFVSSTYEDLQRERRIVIEQILNMGHIPVGMESFNAADDSQWTYIKRRIDESDYYVVIVAERYGAEDGNVSYTRKEYEYAVSTGKPVVAFLLGAEGKKNWPSAKVDYENREKLNAFRELCKSRMVKFWDSADQLGTAVVLSLTELVSTKPGVGWVRGDIVAPNVLEEMASLSSENRMLKDRIREIESRQSEGLIIPNNVMVRIEKMVSSYLLIQNEIDNKIITSGVNILAAFIDLSKNFAVGLSHYGVQNKIPHSLMVINNGQRLIVDDALAEMSSNNLIRCIVEDIPGSTSFVVNKVWYLTEFGADFILYALEWENRGGSARPKAVLSSDTGDR